MREVGGFAEKNSQFYHVKGHVCLPLFLWSISQMLAMKRYHCTLAENLFLLFVAVAKMQKYR